MLRLKKRNQSAPVKRAQLKVPRESSQIRQEVNTPRKKLYTPVNTDIIVSTGCTLLDLNISGGRCRGGGLPGGIMMEIFGPSGSGKTAIITELLASVQYHGGETKIDDPEGRFDKEYARLFNYEMDKSDYAMSNTVNEVFDYLKTWNPANKNVVNLFAVDSIAVLCSDLELSTQGDKRGQAKAKELTTMCRYIATMVSDTHKIVAFTNHEKDGEYGKVTPGGLAVPYLSSLRIRVSGKKPIIKEKTFKTTVRGKEHKRLIKHAVGVQSDCLIKKSSIDSEYRTCPLYIIFGVGIDDIRGNLQYCKDMTKDTLYDVFNKTYQALDNAVKYIEDNNLETDLREHTINLWEQAEELFKTDRKKKVRF